MRKLITTSIAVSLLLGSAAQAPLFARGKGGGGQKGNQTGPKDGTGQQKGKGQKGKRTGPKDGTGPIHEPPQK